MAKGSGNVRGYGYKRHGMSVISYENPGGGRNGITVQAEGRVLGIARSAAGVRRIVRSYISNGRRDFTQRYNDTTSYFDDIKLDGVRI